MIQSWTKRLSEKIAGKFGKSLHRTIFTNPATGQEEEFYLIEQRNWAETLPITEDGMVVAVKQYKQGCDKIILEIPAGTADFKDELPEVVASRELLQETGYEAKQIIPLGPPFGCQPEIRQPVSGSSWVLDV